MEIQRRRFLQLAGGDCVGADVSGAARTFDYCVRPWWHD
jgi:hypothetical protein